MRGERGLERLAKRDYYEVLGVDRGAADGALKKAYRKLAKQYHPDTHPDEPRAAERFKEISGANHVLSDPERRRKYDQMRRFGGLGFGGRAGPRGGGPAGGFRFEDLTDTIEVPFNPVPFADWPEDPTFSQPCPGEFCGVWLFVNDGAVTEMLEQFFVP